MSGVRKLVAVKRVVLQPNTVHLDPFQFPGCGEIGDSVVCVPGTELSQYMIVLRRPGASVEMQMAYFVFP